MGQGRGQRRVKPEMGYMTVREAAALLRCKDENVLYHLRQGRFGNEVKKIGGSYLIPEKEVEKFVWPVRSRGNAPDAQEFETVKEALSEAEMRMDAILGDAMNKIEEALQDIVERYPYDAERLLLMMRERLGSGRLPLRIDVESQNPLIAAIIVLNKAKMCFPSKL